MIEMMRHYHIEVPARHYGRAMILRTQVIDESIKQTVYQIAKEHGIQDIYVLSENEIVNALKAYMTRDTKAPPLEEVESLRIQIAALEKENKVLKDEIMCKDTTIDNSFAVIRRQSTRHQEEVRELQAAISSLQQDLENAHKTIEALVNNPQPEEEEKVVPDCDYYHGNGLCWAQKGAPLCTPGTLSCCFSRRESK